MTAKQRQNVVLAYAMALVLLVIGTFYDLQISGALFSAHSIFAQFFAGHGEAPALLCSWAGGACALAAIEKRRDSRATLVRIATATLMAVSMGLSLFYEMYSVGSVLLDVLLIVLKAAAAVGLFAWVWKHADRTDRELLWRVGIALLTIALMNVIVVNVIKIPWGRPRYRSIVVTEGLDFRPWYVAGTSERQAFEGILAHDEFKSFPSGHAANATCGLALTFLALVIPQLKARKTEIFAAALLWIVAVMVARIMAGAHFLSDVTMGFIITLTVVLVASRVFKLTD